MYGNFRELEDGSKELSCQGSQRHANTIVNLFVERPPFCRDGIIRL